MPCEMLITLKRYAGHGCSNETTSQMHGLHYGLHCMGLHYMGLHCLGLQCMHGVALHGAARMHGTALHGLHNCICCMFYFGGGGGGAGNPIETRLSN